ncbi:MAG: hypothetical protein L0Z50_40170 [Verrucomicrobiales bacterium]|nr:hypothetical protein [Verrucomicrobiales bacterium]
MNGSSRDGGEGQDATRPSPRAVRLLLLGAIALGIAARAVIHFGTPLEPRINGPYYLVQVRSMLESGHLAVPDLPLIFWMQAAVAQAIQFFTSFEQERAIVLACKLVDSIAPVLLVLPAYFLLGRWRNKNLAFVAVAAVLSLAVVHPPLLAMTSEFEKNALGLVWFAALGIGVRETLVGPSPRAATVVLFFLMLTGLTHIGVFGAALLFGTLAFIGGLAFLPARRKWLLGLCAMSICVVAFVLLVMWRWFDPQRGERLLNALLPGKHLVVDEKPAQRAGMAPQPQASSNAGPRRNPPVMPLLIMFILPVVLIHVKAIGALLVVWRQRRPLPPGECVFIAATAVTALVLAWPFVISDRAVRLQMIAVGPLVLLTPFVLTHWHGRRVRLAVATAIFVITMGSLWFSLGWNMKPTIPEDSYEELRSLRTSIADPSRTLIIAPHGLEWWVVWTLRTKFAHSHAVRADDWQKYAMVAVLKQKRGGGPPAWGRRPLSARNQDNAAVQRGGTQQSFDEFSIPADAQILADGTTFALMRLVHPPANLPR